MKDPYEVLGIPRDATREQIKSAYRELAKKYHPDNYAGTPLADLATEKMQEINEAYDNLISGKANYGNSYSNTYSSYGNNYENVLNLIRQGKLDIAEEELEKIPEMSRDAQWYYLKGQINYSRGWTQQAYSYFSMAHNMDPSNAQYAAAYQRMANNRNGGFRTAQRQSHGGGGSCGECDGCQLCTGLLCADCCCDCMGGDLITCC